MSSPHNGTGHSGGERKKKGMPEDASPSHNGTSNGDSAQSNGSTRQDTEMERRFRSGSKPRFNIEMFRGTRRESSEERKERVEHFDSMCGGGTRDLRGVWEELNDLRLETQNKQDTSHSHGATTGAEVIQESQSHHQNRDDSQASVERELRNVDFRLCGLMAPYRNTRAIENIFSTLSSTCPVIEHVNFMSPKSDAFNVFLAEENAVRFRIQHPTDQVSYHGQGLTVTYIHRKSDKGRVEAVMAALIAQDPATHENGDPSIPAQEQWYLIPDHVVRDDILSQSFPKGMGIYWDTAALSRVVVVRGVRPPTVTVEDLLVEKEWRQKGSCKSLEPMLVFCNNFHGQGPVIITSKDDETFPRLMQEGPPTEAMVWKLFADISKGLAFLHNWKVDLVHRGLTPRAILVERSQSGNLPLFKIVCLHYVWPQHRKRDRKQRIFLGPPRPERGKTFVRALNVWELGRLLQIFALRVPPYPADVAAHLLGYDYLVAWWNWVESQGQRDLLFNMVDKAEPQYRPLDASVEEQIEHHSWPREKLEHPQKFSWLLNNWYTQCWNSDPKSRIDSRTLADEVGPIADEVIKNLDSEHIVDVLAEAEGQPPVRVPPEKAPTHSFISNVPEGGLQRVEKSTLVSEVQEHQSRYVGFSYLVYPADQSEVEKRRGKSDGNDPPGLCLRTPRGLDQGDQLLKE